MAIENGITAEDLLEQWLVQCSTADHRAISLEDAQAYRYIWGTWMDYLRTGRKGVCSHAIRWDEADGVAVIGFLDKGVESRKTGARVSDITKRRYWRVLDRVYTFAMERNLAQHNPAKEVSKHEIPKQENPKGFILSARLWHAATDALKAAPENLIDTRNKALLLVLFELGLMPAEIRRLTVDDFVESGEGQGAWLKIASDNPNATRQMELPVHARDAVVSWIKVRATSSKHSSTTALFSAQTGKAMTDENLLVLVRQHLLAACATSGEPPPARLGPQIIRNSRLVRWLIEGVPRSVVVLRAGLKNEKGLGHLLCHLPDGPLIRHGWDAVPGITNRLKLAA